MSSDDDRPPLPAEAGTGQHVPAEAGEPLQEGGRLEQSAPVVPESFSHLDFDSSLLPPKRRLPAIGEAYAAAMLRCRIDPVIDDVVWSRMTASKIGNLHFLDYAGSPMRCVGEGMDGNDISDGAMVDLVLFGSYGIRQGGRETVVGQGEGVIYISHMPFVAESTGSSPLFSKSVMLPGHLIAEVASDAESLAGLHLDASLPEISLLPGYLAGFPLADGGIEPALAATVGRHVAELLIGAIARSQRREDPTEGRGAKAARLAKLLKIIDDNIAQPTLSVVKVARLLGCTDRTVQKVLEETGTTFSELLMEKRLTIAHAALAGAQGGNSITEIAYAAGFSDASHFSHAFRRRFGETPSQVRGTGMSPPEAAE